MHKNSENSKFLKSECSARWALLIRVSGIRIPAGAPKSTRQIFVRCFFVVSFKILKAIPHNSKCRYGERGAANAKPKAQIILDAAKVSAASGGNSEPKQGQRSQSARGFCPRSTMRVPQPDIIEHFGNADAVPQPPERCLSRKAGIVRCCLNKRGKYEEIIMSKFLKSLCKIAIPVTLQSMLQSSFSIVDQIMIGQLGETNISAVGLCGNFSLIFSVMIGAVSTVAGILIAQFIGAEESKEAWCSFDVSLICGIIMSVLFLLAAGVFPSQILGLYTKDMSIVNTGTVYFRIVALSYIPMAVSNILSSWLRCKEYATIPFLASFGAVIVNTGLNYLLIFGKFGFPCMAIKGAAIATLISQLFNLVFIVIGFVLCIKKDGDKPVLSLHFEKITIRDYLIMIMPILISKFLWSFGQNVESAVYGHLGTSNLAAYTLTSPIQGLIVGALSGLSAAAGVMIGKRLGRKEYNEAYAESKKIMYAGLFGGVTVSALLILLAGAYTGLYRVDDSVKELGKTLLIVFALYAPVKVENMILGGGIIRSGGNTKTIMIIDIIGTWCIGIPLCLLAAYVFKWGIVGVYTLLTTEELFRLAVSLIIFKRRNWIVSLC